MGLRLELLAGDAGELLWKSLLPWISAAGAVSAAARAAPPPSVATSSSYYRVGALFVQQNDVTGYVAATETRVLQPAFGKEWREWAYC